MLFGITLCGVFLCFYKRSRLKDGIFLLISFIVLTVMSAVRYDVGYDYSFVYAPWFYEMIEDPSILAQSRWEPGFRLFLRGLLLISNNFQTVFVATSILIIFLVMLFFWLYSPNPFISVFLFVTLSHFYCSMNFTRQTIAAAIAMFTVPLLKKVLEKLKEREFVKCIPFALGYMGVVLIASSFHMSTLILVPFFFLLLIPINRYVLAAYAVVTTMIYLNTENIILFVTRFWYQGYGIDSRHMQVGFSSPFAISAAVLFLALFIGFNFLIRDYEKNRVYVSYAYFAFFFVLMGMRHSILDRLALPFVLLVPVGVAILVSEFSQQHLTKPYVRQKVAGFVVLLVMVFGGGLAIHHYALTADHHGVVPYQIIFNQPFYREYVQRLRGNIAEYEEEAEIEPEHIELPPLIINDATDAALEDFLSLQEN